MSDLMNQTVRLTTMRELEQGKVVTQNRLAWRRTQLSVPAGAKWRGHPTFRPATWGELGRWNLRLIGRRIKEFWEAAVWGPPCPKHPGHRTREIDMDITMPMSGLPDMCSACFDEMEERMGWRR